MKVERALDVLEELRERGDCRASELAKRKLKAAELDELAGLKPPLVTSAPATGEGQKRDTVYGITGWGQRWLQEKNR